MIRFFRSPQPAALFVIPFIAIILWLAGWGHVPVYDHPNLAPLWKPFVPLFLRLPDFVRWLLLVALVSFSAIKFNLLMNRHEVLYKNSYLPSLFYVVLVSSLPEFMTLHPLHVVNLLLLSFLDNCFDFFKNDRVVRPIFNAGWIISIIVLLYLPLFPLLVFFFLVLTILRSVSLREWLMAATGVLFPIFLLTCWWFPTPLPEKVQWLIRYAVNYRWLPMASLNLPQQVFVWTTVGMLLFSLLKLRGNYYKNTVRTRYFQQALFFLLLFGVGLLFLNGRLLWIHTVVLTIPAAAFLSYWFVSAKKRLSLFELLLWSYLFVLAWNRFPALF